MKTFNIALYSTLGVLASLQIAAQIIAHYSF